MMTPSSIFIIGGGIQGVCTAYYLTQLAKKHGRSISVTILEGSGIAAGASGKAGGLLALDWHGPSTSSLSSLSYKLHCDLANEHDGGRRWGYRTLDTLSVSADMTRATKKREDVVSSKKLKEKNGFFDWLNQDALGETSVLGTRESTAQVHPRLFTQGLAEIMLQEGDVKVVYGSATALNKNEDGSFTVKYSPRQEERSSKASEQKSIRTAEMSLGPADRLVITAGPWTGSLLKQLGIQGGGRTRRIEGSRAHSVVFKTAESRALPAQALFTSIKEKAGSFCEPEIYNRPDGTAYACGPTDDSSLPTLASEVEIDPSATALIIQQVADLAPEYLSVNDGPHSATIEVEQACYLPVGSGDPVIGKVEENVWVGAGHSCWGILNGPATGLCLAELILEGKASSADIRRLGP
ncbi:BZ3500_MvSof-1268-A1-R1_Chr8-2g10195 [Microbotryum saponariae]|uniref:BZ3500_MvSof-1268-A1-R1_Chr8-2g10195 protein n=1 Tax=Microbotryum saponariae TaxID=289078 RepID=A0A2X0LRV9_9BASI|nr:BZ3500_MvSof-1268-A1-R1_Chr8-2g10195 [Microbotryum saponariae]SDA01983.1 BZ3501_MvSof-1269-A2-R1_Chr8-2g09945 [Microbotryum saponariae]